MEKPSPELSPCVCGEWFISLGVARTTDISARPPITGICSPKTCLAESMRGWVQFYVMAVVNKVMLFSGTQTSPPRLWYSSIKAPQKLLLKVGPGQYGYMCDCALQQALIPHQQGFSCYTANDELCIGLGWEKNPSCAPFLRKPARALRWRMLTSRYKANTGGKASPSWRHSPSSGYRGPECLEAWRKLCLDARAPRQSRFANSATILSIFQKELFQFRIAWKFLPFP